MAVTKIKAIHKDLNYCLGYAIDPQKTDPLKFFYDHVTDSDCKQGQLYATGINCNVDTAFKEMMDTKRRYSKEGRRVLGYHIMQSFKPGEVDPDTAHNRL